MAVLIGGHRHRITKSSLKLLPESWREPALRLLLLFRLSVLLNRSRNAAEMPACKLLVDGNSLTIGFDSEWLEANPLTIADLERGKGFMEQVGYELVVAS